MILHDSYHLGANEALLVLFLLFSTDSSVLAFLLFSLVHDPKGEDENEGESELGHDYVSASHPLYFLVLFHLPFFHIHSPFSQNLSRVVDHNRELV